MLDLSPMKEISVDPSARTVDRRGRRELGRVRRRDDQAHGLATTGGRVTTTGIAGLTLGTGSGWLERLHGYTADNLHLGRRRHRRRPRSSTRARTRTPDLFWGLRGGGGNFGVVVNFEYRLHEVPPLMLGGMLLWPFDRAGDVIRALPRVHRGRARRGRRRRRAPDRAARAVRPAGAAGAARRRRHRDRVRRIPSAARSCSGRCASSAAGRRHRRADAVHGGPAAARPGQPARPLQLLEGRARRRAQRRADRPLDRARRADGPVALGDAVPAARRRRSRAFRTTRTRSPRGTPRGRAHCIGEWETPEETRGGARLGEGVGRS